MSSNSSAEKSNDTGAGGSESSPPVEDPNVVAARAERARAITEPLLQPLNELRDLTLKLVEERHTSTPAEKKQQVATLNTLLATMRQRIKDAPKINKSEKYLKAKAADLKRQIRVMDEFFEKQKRLAQELSDSGGNGGMDGGESMAHNPDMAK